MTLTRRRRPGTLRGFPPALRRVVVAGVVAAAGAACSRREPERPPVVTVQTATAVRASISAVVRADAVLYPLSQAAIVPKISAPVKRFLVQRGDRVRKGQLVAVLENADLIAAAAQASGQYEQAEANLRATTGASVPEEAKKAEGDLQAAKEALAAATTLLDSRRALLRQGAIARRLVDEAQVGYAQAKAQHDAAEQHLRSLQAVGREATIRQAQAQRDAAKGQWEAARAQVRYTEIRSPIDGVVTERPLYAGEMAAAGSPLLTVMDASAVVARAPVPQEQAAPLHVGAAATLSVPGVADPVKGTVTIVSPALDPSSTTVQVWIQAPNPGGRLKPGTSVRASIVARTFPDAIVVPQEALLTGPGGRRSVMVVGADRKARARDVDAGITEGGRVQIVAGVQAGETVVTTGAYGLADGTEVTVQPPPRGPGGAAGE